jgi:hypothetical protein
VINFTLRPLHPHERITVPIELEATWAQGRSGRFRKETYHSPIPGFIPWTVHRRNTVPLSSQQNYISRGTVLAVRPTTPPGCYNGVIRMTPKEVTWMMRHVFTTLLHMLYALRHQDLHQPAHSACRYLCLRRGYLDHRPLNRVTTGLEVNIRTYTEDWGGAAVGTGWWVSFRLRPLYISVTQPGTHSTGSQVGSENLF